MCPHLSGLRPERDELFDGVSPRVRARIPVERTSPIRPH
jgi:hypothetical protein